MDKEEVLKKAREYARAVDKALHPKQVILYGSYVAGKPREDSDIDVAVVFDSLQDRYLETAQMLYKLRHAIDERIEPVPFEEKNDTSGFLRSILTYGINILD